MTVNYKFRCLESLKIMAMKQIRDYFLRREIKLTVYPYVITVLIVLVEPQEEANKEKTDQDIKE